MNVIIAMLDWIGRAVTVALGCGLFLFFMGLLAVYFPVFYLPFFYLPPFCFPIFYLPTFYCVLPLTLMFGVARVFRLMVIEIFGIDEKSN